MARTVGVRRRPRPRVILVKSLTIQNPTSAAEHGRAEESFAVGHEATAGAPSRPRRTRRRRRRVAVAPLDLHSPITVPPSLSTPDGLAALRARLNEARADAAFAPSLPISQAARHAHRSNMRSDLIPAIVAPPCLVNDVSHIAFAQLRTPIHNPTTLIHDAILAHAGNPSFSVAGSWRGAGCGTFESASVREYLVSLGSLDYRGNQISFQPVELADRASPVFDQLIEVKASEFPHELWHDDGIRWALSHLGDVCSIDHYCIEGRDFTAVRALIMVDRQTAAGLTAHLAPTVK